MTSPPGTSPCPPASVPRWPASWPPAPRIVAESLAAVTDPLRTVLGAGPPASGARRWRARSRGACAAAGNPSGRRRPGCCRARREASAECWPRSSGTAARCSPIPSAAARRTSRSRWRPHCARPTRVPRPRHARAPVARASPQAAWRAGRDRHPPAGEPGTPARPPRAGSSSSTRATTSGTRRPGATAMSRPGCWAGRVLLLSATPIVNRLDDLAHQLLLGVRDDALLADGVLSLRAALAAGSGIAALGRLVLEDTRRGRAPSGRTASVRATPTTREEEAVGGACSRAWPGSSSRGTRRRPPSIRGVLLRAAASSPAALAGALRRYRGLLHHAADARRAGRALSRAELRAFAGELDDQLVLWELVADGHGDAGARARGPRHDRCACSRGRRVQPTHPTPSSTGSADAALATDVRRSCSRLAARRCATCATGSASPVAWCTGDRAGLGPCSAPRSRGHAVGFGMTGNALLCR